MLYLYLSFLKGRKEGRMPCPLQPEMAYWGEKISARDALDKCVASIRCDIADN